MVREAVDALGTSTSTLPAVQVSEPRLASAVASVGALALVVRADALPEACVLGLEALLGLCVTCCAMRLLIVRVLTADRPTGRTELTHTHTGLVLSRGTRTQPVDQGGDPRHGWYVLCACACACRM